MQTEKSDNEATIPARTPPDYAEYWRVKGGEHGSVPRTVCCFCHAIYGMPTDGWEVAPDGRNVMAASVAEHEAA